MFRTFHRRARRAYLACAVLTCGLLGASFGGAAHAGPITFVYDPDNTTAAFTSLSGFCIGCTPTVVKRPTPIRFELTSIGESFEIPDFLSISIDGLLGSGFALGRGQGTLEANIAFSAPTSALSSTASADGQFVARVTRRFQYRQDGSIAWTSQPSNLVFGDGTEIALRFGDASDRCRNFGCFGNGLSVDIAAVSTLEKIPEPGVLALLGAGLLGFGLMRRRPGGPIVG